MLTETVSLTFGYHEHSEIEHDKAREECCLIKAIAESMYLTVDERTVDGWYFGTVQGHTASMLKLTRQLAAKGLARQTSIEAPDKRTMLRFSNIAGLGELVFHHCGHSYLCRANDLPGDFQMRISRATAT